MLAPLHNTVIFRKLFRDPEILTAFIKDLTGIELHITAENIEIEKRFPVPLGAIDVAFDIFVDAPDQRIVVEVQKVRYGYHYDRFLHYHSAAIMELQKSYRDYAINKTVYTVVWLTARSSDPIFRKGLITTSYDSVASDGEKLPIFPHRMYFINPAYLDSSIPSALSDWLQLATESINNPSHPHINLSRAVLQKATDLIADDTLTPVERSQIMDENDFERSREKRYQDGRVEGRQQRDEEIAHSMIQKGLDLSLIAEITGLSISEIAALTPHDGQ